MKPLAAFALLFVASACKPDALADYRKQCKDLSEQKVLRSGLSIDACAQELKQRADLADPARRAAELVERVDRLVAAGKGRTDASQQAELKDAVLSIQALGHDAVAPTLAAMKEARDPDVRIALAKALVNLCTGDCALSRYECIVPALLEGTTEDKPSAVRIESEKGLVRCTGEQLGDDPAAWRSWWAAKEKEPR